MQINRKIKRFYLENIRKEIKVSVERLSKQVYMPFPKEEGRWLSHYVYREFEIHIDSKGILKGDLLRLIFSLIDFSFVRCLVANCYSEEGGDCHEPVTLFLLEVIKVFAGYVYYPEFIEDLNDENKGAQYRYYVGVDIENIPTEATFHNFRDRVGEEKLQEILRFLVNFGKSLRDDPDCLRLLCRVAATFKIKRCEPFCKPLCIAQQFVRHRSVHEQRSSITLKEDVLKPFPFGTCCV